jgi:hypothetical protein
MTERGARAGLRRHAERALVLGIALALVLRLAQSVPIFVNDDAFVYFNYAKNFALGRPFAYDPRNLPSEGFTSWLFLLLLVPGELTGLNPMLAAMLLNLVGLAASALAVARIASGTGGPRAGSGAGLAFLALAASDASLRALAGLGLETLLSGSALLWLVAAGLDVWRHGESESAPRRFWILALLATFTRPENAAIAAAIASALALRARGAAAALVRGTPLALALAAAWLGLKLWLFGDLFPTSYYRKLDPASAQGARYVAAFVSENAWPLAGSAFACAIAWHRSRSQPAAARVIEAVTLLAVCAFANALVVLNIDPLVGFGHRFLIGAWLSACALLALAAVSLFPRAALPLASACAAAVAVALPIESPDLRDRIEIEFERHSYVQLGRQLRAALEEPERATVVFGDAGALPWALGSIFIDPNGLSEPAIAKLFREPSESERARRLADYLVAQHPDLVVIGYGRASDDGRLSVGVNRHSPLREPDLSTAARLIDEGFRYACSARAYSDLHFALNPHSPRFAEVSEALSRYCSGPIGYVLREGLTLEAKGRRVHVARLGAASAPAPLDLLPRIID